MSARSVIVIGDKTTHGGTVLQGSQTMTAGGKNVARHVNRIVSPYVIRNHETPFAPSQPGMTAGETRKNPADSRTIHRDRREISGPFQKNAV